MFIAAFVLGLWLGWLLEAATRNRPQPPGPPEPPVPPEPPGPREPPHPPVQYGWPRIVAAALFILAFGFYCLAVVTAYFWVGITWPTQAMRFITAPQHLRMVAWFAFGALLYRYRGVIGTFVQSLLLRPSRRHGLEPRPWLTTAGGLPILGTILAVTILVYFGEDLRTRLKSIKFGPAEADFSTATQETLRLGGRQEGTASSLYRSYTSIVRGFEYRDVFKEILGPTQDHLAASVPANGNGANARWQAATTFHSTFTFPLSDVMACYSTHFPPGDTEVHQKVVRAATDWRLLSEKAARLSPDKTHHSPADRQTLHTHFCTAACGTRDLIHRALADVTRVKDAIDIKSKACEKLFAPTAEPIASCPPPKPDAAATQSVPCLPADTAFANDIPELLTNGTVMSFIAGLVAAGDSYRRAAAYLTDVGKRFDAEAFTTDPIGKMYFYLRRAQAKFEGRWYPKDATSDLRMARSLVDQIILATDRHPNPKREHFETVRAGIINNEIYYAIFQWLEGQPLSAYDMTTFELLGRELEDWLESGWVKTLVITDDRQVITKNRVVAAIRDTLAMNEIAIGATKRDFTPERCERIRSRLVASYDLYQRLYTVAPSQVRDYLSLVEAHRFLYENVCAH